jgi:hypothetical protein
MIGTPPAILVSPLDTGALLACYVRTIGLGLEPACGLEDKNIIFGENELLVDV